MTEIRFFKTISCIILVAIFALFYAHLQVEIVKTSLVINEHRSDVSFLLDQYRTLVYNLSQLESPKSIEDTLCFNEIVLAMPKRSNAARLDRVDLAYTREKPKVNNTFLAKLFDRFSVKAEAEVVR